MSAAPSHDCTLATASHLADAPEHLPTEPRAQAIYAVRQELSSALGLTVPRSEGALHLADRLRSLGMVHPQAARAVSQRISELPWERNSSRTPGLAPSAEVA